MLKVWIAISWGLAPLLRAIARILHARMGAEPDRFAERLGHSGLEGKPDVLWFHAASIGEATQISALARTLYSDGWRHILVTTTTATGAAWVAREMPFVIHRYAPLDTPGAARRFLRGWTLAALVYVEGDIWPRLVHAVAERGAPQILLNARHSKTRERFPAVFAIMLHRFALVTCRSQGVAAGITSLGIPEERVVVLPDLRLTLPQIAVAQPLVQMLAKAGEGRPLWLAASTHPADETAVLHAHQACLRAFPNALLLLAPRHPQRGAPLHQLAQQLGMGVSRRSLEEPIAQDTQVYIADTLGELGAFYAASPLAFLGGSFGAEGGHTPYEPASLNTAVLHGPNVRHFKDAYAELAAAGAVQSVASPDDLGPAVVRLLQGSEATDMARAGQAYMGAARNSLADYTACLTRVIADRR